MVRILLNRHTGIPQGSPISALLANIYLKNFDLEINDYIERLGGKYWRYSDDILLIVPGDENKEVIRKITREIKEYKLEINPSKVDKVIFKKNNNILSSDKKLQYLGFTFDGSNILLRDKTISKYYRKLNKKINIVNLVGRSNSKNTKLYRKVFYNNYSHLGRKNFYSYVKKSCEIMEEPKIRRQLRNHWKFIAKRLD